MWYVYSKYYSVLEEVANLYVYIDYLCITYLNISCFNTSQCRNSRMSRAMYKMPQYAQETTDYLII